ncbi:MAG: radical SAM protein [Gammaproteobacteria bacterium]
MSNLSIASTLPAIQDKELEFFKYANLLAVLISRAGRWHHVPGKPLEITVDAATACNLNCPYCATGNGTLQRPREILTLESHAKIMAFCGRETFIGWYFSNGEPLLNKHLPELIKDAAQNEIFSVISTNLSVPLGWKKLQELVQSGLGMVSASIDGVSRKTYNKYRVGGDFELVLENLKTLVQIKNACGQIFPLIEWRFLLFEHNQHEMAEVLALAREIGVDLVEFFYGHVPSGAAPGGVQRSTLRSLPFPAVSGPYLSVANQRSDTLLRKRLLKRKNPQRAFVPDPDNRKCDWLYFSGMYYPQGHVGPCCVVGDTQTDFGSLALQSNFNQIWNGATYEAARKAVKGLKTPGIRTVCRSCPLPEAQYNMFKNTLKAYLLNAPEWFLAIVSSRPEVYFHPYDFKLISRELEEIERLRRDPLPLDQAVYSRLEKFFARRPRIMKNLERSLEK